MTTEHMLIIAIGALTSVVVLLWRHFEASAKRMEQKHDECDTDRRALWAKVAELEGASCKVVGCPMRQPLTEAERSAAPFPKP